MLRVRGSLLITTTDVIATSEVSISLTVDDEQDLDRIVKELQLIAEVELSHHKAICCLVGEGLKTSKRMFTRVFSVLENNSIPVSMISLGASEINITFVVNEDDAHKAARALHAEFFRPK